MEEKFIEQAKTNENKYVPRVKTLLNTLDWRLSVDGWTYAIIDYAKTSECIDDYRSVFLPSIIKKCFSPNYEVVVEPSVVDCELGNSWKVKFRTAPSVYPIDYNRHTC